MAKAKEEQAWVAGFRWSHDDTQEDLYIIEITVKVTENRVTLCSRIPGYYRVYIVRQDARAALQKGFTESDSYTAGRGTAFGKTKAIALATMIKHQAHASDVATRNLVDANRKLAALGHAQAVASFKEDAPE